MKLTVEHGDPENLLLADGSNTVAVWAWDDAPEDLRALTRGHYDDAYVALVPKDYRRNIEFITHSVHFSGNILDKYELASGQVLYVGA